MKFFLSFLAGVVFILGVQVWAQDEESEDPAVAPDPQQIDLIEIQDKMIKEQKAAEELERSGKPTVEKTKPERMPLTKNQKLRKKRLRERKKVGGT